MEMEANEAGEDGRDAVVHHGIPWHRILELTGLRADDLVRMARKGAYPG